MAISEIVTNPVHAIPFTHHQRSLVHHIDSYTTLLLPFTIELHFPSSTALTFCVFLCFDSCPCFPGFTLSLALWTLFGSLLVYLDYLSALPYWILFADRRPTLALGLLSALSVLYLFATVRPCLCFDHVPK